MDASFTVAYEDVQHNVRGSRILNQERLDTKVGPIEVKVLEPLKRLEVIVEDKDIDISARLIFEGYCEALQEPQMYLYDGPRLTMDTCRMVQHGSWSGKININGKEVKFNSNNNVGTRDRSWGIRPVGAYDLSLIHI